MTLMDDSFPTRTGVSLSAMLYYIILYFSGSYDCIDDDVEARDLSVSISNPDTGEIIFESPKGRREGTFQLDSTVVKANTRYGLCFQNSEKADDDEKENEFDVGFSIHVTKAPRTLKDEEIGPDGERALQLVSKATRIQQDWTNLMDHYEYVRNREGVHQDMNDAILSRLSRWNTMEALVVIGMATGQVMYWKRFFETKRYL
jgi:hypothetical protein